MVFKTFYNCDSVVGGGDGQRDVMTLLSLIDAAFHFKHMVRAKRCRHVV